MTVLLCPAKVCLTVQRAVTLQSLCPSQYDFSKMWIVDGDRCIIRREVVTHVLGEIWALKSSVWGQDKPVTALQKGTQVHAHVGSLYLFSCELWGLEIWLEGIWNSFSPHGISGKSRLLLWNIYFLSFSFFSFFSSFTVAFMFCSPWYSWFCAKIWNWEN